VSPNELQALDLIRERLSVAGYAPTYRELAAEIGVTLSGAHRCVAALVEAGAVKRTPSKTRGLAVVDLPDMRTVPTDVLRAELARRGVSFAALNPAAPRAIGHEVTCAADTCGTVVQRGHLMCLTHWRVLPHELRNRILRSNAARDQHAFGLAVTEARDLIDNTDWRERA
jgi:hypothetical protein